MGYILRWKTILHGGWGYLAPLDNLLAPAEIMINICLSDVAVYRWAGYCDQSSPVSQMWLFTGGRSRLLWSELSCLSDVVVYRWTEPPTVIRALLSLRCGCLQVDGAAYCDKSSPVSQMWLFTGGRSRLLWLDLSCLADVAVYRWTEPATVIRALLSLRRACLQAY